MLIMMKVIPKEEFFKATALDEIFECNEDGQIKSFNTWNEADDYRMSNDTCSLIVELNNFTGE